MEEAAIEGVSGLVNYGVLGIMCLVFMAVIAFIIRYLKQIVTLLIKDKDDQIEKRDKQLDGVLVQLATNSTQQLALNAQLIESVRAVPERTVEKIKLSKLED